MDAGRLQVHRAALLELWGALDRRLMLVERDLDDDPPGPFVRPRAPQRLAAKAVTQEILHLACERQQVQEALRRMVQGTYGLCATCNAPIGAERLEVKPESLLCRACATAPV